MAQLNLYHRTGRSRFLDRAAAAGDTLLGTVDRVPTPGPGDPPGLLHGRSGIALLLHHLAGDTGEDAYLAAGRGLLHAELDGALPLPGGSLSFPDAAHTGRATPYLESGTAGVAVAVSRYAAADDRLAGALPRLRGDLARTCTGSSGLYGGLAGLAFALADLDDPAAAGVATGLAKYAVPGPAGVRFLGDGGMRFSCELASGAAGVLLALHRVTEGASGQFFTLQGSGRERPPATAGAAATAGAVCSGSA
jgi:hypothetical protein